MTGRLIITDCPEALDGFADNAGQADWQTANLPADTQRNWQAVGGLGQARIVHYAAPTPWQQIMAVGHSSISQLDGLRELLQTGGTPPTPFASLALTGDNFHGNRGRPWRALDGNLHLTALFSPQRTSAELGLGLSMLPTLAVVDALGRFNALALAPCIKWVNDVLLNGRKISGVITSTLAKGDRIEHAILGIGVNIAATPKLPSGRFVQPPGSLRELAPDILITLPAMLSGLLDSLAKRYQQLLVHGPSALHDDYLRHSCVIGRHVEVWEETAGEQDEAKRLTAGRVADILPDLSLQLEGVAEPVRRGRLIFAD
ncbi:MAG: biotin--[acetyl-CoA-carboxylase] ligase [Verrucomicrobiota bacterium]|nr:biotin--[acetyl-CoA-carboxylase] ligase [Verrucomicrobiota bacterium]